MQHSCYSLRAATSALLSVVHARDRAPTALATAPRDGVLPGPSRKGVDEPNDPRQQSTFI